MPSIKLRIYLLNLLLKMNEIFVDTLNLDKFEKKLKFTSSSTIFGNGIPTAITQRARSSAKSIPSDTWKLVFRSQDFLVFRIRNNKEL